MSVNTDYPLDARTNDQRLVESVNEMSLNAIRDELDGIQAATEKHEASLQSAQTTNENVFIERANSARTFEQSAVDSARSTESYNPDFTPSDAQRFTKAMYAYRNIYLHNNSVPAERLETNSKSRFKNPLSLFTGSKKSKQAAPSNLNERKLIEFEAEVGRNIFGPTPKNARREFFCLDEETWVWHEEGVDENKKKRVVTTRYEIHENGILKVENSKNYQFIDGKELQNFGLAVRAYYERVMRGVYNRDPYTGQLLTEVPATINSDGRL